ncbi:sulfatase [Patescibacteria group bacterium]|nr:sulfatase [Patescibacteria group bacterium]
MKGIRIKTMSVVLAGAIALTIIAAPGLLPKPKPYRISPCQTCNVIIIDLDPLRPDHIGAYGYPKNTTPGIDAVAKRGIVFTNAVSSSSWTLPAVGSLLTGVYPSTHGVTNKYIILPSGKEQIANLHTLAPRIKTIADVFKADGYATAAFTGGAALNREFGFNEGFDVYTDKSNFGGFDSILPDALRWIGANKNKKLFIFLQAFDVHGQYVPKGGYDHRFVDFPYRGPLTGSAAEQKNLREEGLARGEIYLTRDDVRFLLALYDEKISRADQRITEFLRQYASLGLMGKTILIITSDHGDEFYEHGQIDHGHSLYDELVRIPLIIAMPGETGRVTLTDQVRNIDIMPTVLALVGIHPSQDVYKQFAGINLLPVINGSHIPLDAFSETEYRYATNLRSVRTPDGQKLITNFEDDTQELFNVATDKKEQKNLIRTDYKDSLLLDQKLNTYLLK